MLFDFDNQPVERGAMLLIDTVMLGALKRINIDLTSSFSTNHHTNLERINVFRQERWLFSSYKGIILQEVYVVNPRHLETYFSKWEQSVKEKIAANIENAHLNNPKIPLKYVKEVGNKSISYFYTS